MVASSKAKGPANKWILPEELTASSQPYVGPAAAGVANRKAFPGRPEPAPAQPLLGSLDLSPQATPGEQFQSEISTTVSVRGQMFVVSSGGGGTLQVTNATDPSAITLEERVTLTGYNSQSVASFGNLLAVALSPSDYSSNGGKGVIRFYRVGAEGGLTFLQDVQVGYLPDSITFNDKGTKLVIANEGEPITGYGVAGGKDPVGSIGIIDIKGQANLRFSYTELDFAGLTLPTGLRISGPAGTTQATDIEPEYVSILGNYAYVTLQENNGVAKVNLKTNSIETIFALGTVDYKNQLVDLSDKDGGFKPLLGQNFEGLRMADGIAAYSVKGKDYFVTANEGDAREYTQGTAPNVVVTYKDESGNGPNPNVRTLTDDATAGSPDRITTFGGRSISLFDADTGALLWDSGNSLQTIAVAAGMYADGRSDSKGVEPEGVVVAQMKGRSYAIVSMERTTKSMLAVFDVTDPAAVSFVTSTVIAGSISPEGLHVVDAKQSPTGRSQLIVSNEVSNTLNVFDLQALIAAPPVAGAGAFTSTMLKDVVGGPQLSITSLITNGEFTNGLNPGDSVFAPTGIFDGQGAYDNGDGTFTLLVNSELGADRGYGYLLPGVDGGLTGARVSTLVIDKDVDDDASNGFQSKVLRGGLAYDSIHLDSSDVAIDQASDLGAVGFKRFCSANLVEANSFGAGIGFADRVYLVGEEEFSGDGGSFFALDVDGRALHEVVGFGKGTWESATIIDTGSADTVSVLLFDDAKAPLFLWVGTKSSAADASFLERNGLAQNQGTLYTYVTTALPEKGVVDDGPDSLDLLAFTKANGLNAAINGSWVDLASVDPNYTQLGAPALRQLAVGAGALQLSRIEDGEVNPLNGQQAVFVSTGTTDFNKGDLYGNVYTLDFGAAFGSDGLISGPGDSVLKVVYDGDLLVDPTTGLRNPDNMTISADGHAYIQEDRANGGGTDTTLGNFGTQEASIWKLAIDPITGSSTGEAQRWAQIDRTAVPTAYGQSQPGDVTQPNSNGVGNWESSGIIDVSTIYGSAPGSFFIANVQAHSLGGGNIQGAGYLVEGGQIDLIQQTVPLI
ncbi:PhoX family protein [Synechococcus sp. CS-1332]|uniref:PhoX family protein n=1 Tax=Synechococcus sp. CS-1332 TaxID=2847972 RepID=UPI00223BA863|nr:PhoX family protein [Synechococcus sp. CS-1332]MCT0208693.1 PhoX family protein [Synechococcus sp. CS-1332]